MNDMPLVNLPKPVRYALIILLAAIAAVLAAGVWADNINQADDTDRLVTMLAAMQIVLTALIAVFISGVSRSGSTTKSLLKRSDQFLTMELPEALGNMHFIPAPLGDFKATRSEVEVEVAHYAGDVRADLIVTAKETSLKGKSVLIDVNVKVDTVTLVVKIPSETSSEHKPPTALRRWVAITSEGFATGAVNGSQGGTPSDDLPADLASKHVLADTKVSDHAALHIPLVQRYGTDFLYNPTERLKCAQQISASVRDLMMLELQTGESLLWDRDVVSIPPKAKP